MPGVRKALPGFDDLFSSALQALPFPETATIRGARTWAQTTACSPASSSRNSPWPASPWLTWRMACWMWRASAFRRPLRSSPAPLPIFAQFTIQRISTWSSPAWRSITWSMPKNRPSSAAIHAALRRPGLSPQHRPDPGPHPCATTASLGRLVGACPRAGSHRRANPAQHRAPPNLRPRRIPARPARLAEGCRLRWRGYPLQAPLHRVVLR